MLSELELKTCTPYQRYLIKQFCYLYFFLRQEIHAILLIIVICIRKQELAFVFGIGSKPHSHGTIFWILWLPSCPLSLGLSSLCVACRCSQFRRQGKSMVSFPYLLMTYSKLCVPYFFSLKLAFPCQIMPKCINSACC